MTAVLIIAAFIGIGVFLGLIATAMSPVGYQDESGFHYGPGKKPSDEKVSGYRVPHPEAA